MWGVSEDSTYSKDKLKKRKMKEFELVKLDDLAFNINKEIIDRWPPLNGSFIYFHPNLIIGAKFYSF